MYPEPAEGTLSSEELDSGAAAEFTLVEGEIEIPDALCAAGMDHIVLVVETAREDMAECITYNNYHSHHFNCKTEGTQIISNI